MVRLMIEIGYRIYLLPYCVTLSPDGELQVGYCDEARARSCQPYSAFRLSVKTLVIFILGIAYDLTQTLSLTIRMQYYLIFMIQIIAWVFEAILLAKSLTTYSLISTIPAFIPKIGMTTLTSLLFHCFNFFWRFYSQIPQP